MKAVLMSIQPKWCEKILNGEKTIEVRKTRPKIETPFKCYIYKTKKRILRDFAHKGDELWGTCGQIADKTEIISCCDFNGGKVIGEFVCDKIDVYPYGDMSYPTPAYDGDPSVCECGNGYWIICGEIEQTGLTYEDLEAYGKGKTLYGWHISDLKIYDEPRELGEFLPYCEGRGFCDGGAVWDGNEWHYGVTCGYSTRNCGHLICAPQSWQYVEEVGE